MADGNPIILDDANPPGKNSVGSQSVSENDSEQVDETVASRARSVAKKIKNLAADVRESFASTSKKERVATLNEKTGKILVEMFPVVTCLERRRPPDKAELLKRRIYDVCELAVECAAHDVPEFAGDRESKNEGERMSPGWLLVVELAAMEIHISQSLLDWADEIEVEETAETSPSLSNVNQRTAVSGEIDPPKCYVTLMQMSAIVNRAKRTLERLIAKPSFPSPNIEGGGGKPSEWLWSVVRPILKKEYDRPLPEVFPADQFVL